LDLQIFRIRWNSLRSVGVTADDDWLVCISVGSGVVERVDVLVGVFVGFAVDYLLVERVTATVGVGIGIAVDFTVGVHLLLRSTGTSGWVPGLSIQVVCSGAGTSRLWV